MSHLYLKLLSVLSHCRVFHLKDAETDSAALDLVCSGAIEKLKCLNILIVVDKG